MTNKHLKVGIIGAGDIVKYRHAPGLAKIDDLSIVSVCNSSITSAQKFANEWARDAKICENPEDIIYSDCDIVWIGTPPYMHCELTCSALAAGKHVFCQSRMAMNVEEAELMLKTAKKYPKLVTALCPPPMGLNVDQFMKSLLSESVIGRPHQIILHSSSKNYLDPSIPAHWRQKSEISGINILRLGIYIEILHRWFVKITTVYAEENTITPIRNGYSINIPDTVNLLCKFENGLHSIFYLTGVAAHPKGDMLEIFGDKGTIEYIFKPERLMIGTMNDRSLKTVSIPTHLTKEWTVERDFIAAVRAPMLSSPQPDFQEGLAYMRVLQAAHKSILEKRMINVNHC